MTEPRKSLPVDSLLHNIWRLLKRLSLQRRWQLAGLLLLTLVGAVAELATIGVVLPFLALLADRQLTSRYPQLGEFFRLIGWSSNDDILLPVTFAFVTVVICATAIRVFLTWTSFNFIFDVGVDIGAEIYRRTLHQPYRFHVDHNTSEIIAGLSKAQTIAFGVIGPALQIVVSGVFSLAIVATLVRIDPVMALLAATAFAVVYSAVTLGTRQRLRANSKLIAELETKRVQAIQEGLGAIRDVIIDDTQMFFVERFRRIDGAQRRAQSSNFFIGTAPRFVVEGVGVTLIAGLAYWLSLRMGGLSGAMPVIGALALGAQRLMPQIQQLYSSWATLAGNRANFADALDLLDRPVPAEYAAGAPTIGLRMEQDLGLHDVSFRYNIGGSDVVRSVDLCIRRGSRVGFIGKTGSGKSTVIDLIMGLLDPTRGFVKIDRELLNSANRRAWQARIAHVPQSIYLADASIAENIAFGRDPREIDIDRIRDAARKAQLAEFVETLPHGYQTVVGERGVRLSGGQRQRIGLARALYKSADLLVLDEATSALDDATEASVMDAIEALGDSVTVLMVAHRVSTLKNCDSIFELRNGEIIRRGRYNEMFRQGDQSLDFEEANGEKDLQEIEI